MNNKKIIFQVTRTYMKMNKKRTAITFAGILVMVVLMTAVFVGKDTVMTFMQNAVAADQGRWHYQVFDLKYSEVEKIKALPSVEKLEISRPLGYTEFAASGNPEETPFLELKGYSGDIFDWMNIRVIEGRYPENDHEILLSERALKEGSTVKVGDTLDVDTFDRYIHALYMEGEEEAIKGGKEPGFVVFGSGFSVQHGETKKEPDHFPYFADGEFFEEVREYKGNSGTYTIVGFMESPYYESMGQGGYIALTKTNSEVGAEETVNAVLTIDLKTKDDVFFDIAEILDDSRSAEEREALRVGGTYYQKKDGTQLVVKDGQIKPNDVLLTFSAKGSDGNLNFLLIFVQAFFIVLITVASLVLIYNVFSMSYKERSRYLGMLSSVGATRAQKRWSVYYEVFSLLLTALPFGIVLGLVLVKAGMMMLQPSFSKIISMIATNVITGRSCEIDYRIIVNPTNLLFVAIFSALAVWLSAYLPAVKISKVGPIESIRESDTSLKAKKKGYPTAFRYLKKGKAEGLLASCLVNRNRHSTGGIIRSITAFISLTLITAFSIKSVSDLVHAKADTALVNPGKAFQGYDYVFSTDIAEDYASGKKEIMSSDEVTGYKELNISSFSYFVAFEDYSDEYRNTMETILRKYFPNGFPDFIMEMYLEPKYTESNPSVVILTLSREDFQKVADNAGVDLLKDLGEDRVQALVYNRLTLSTDDFKHSFSDAEHPDYSIYQLGKPFQAKRGETINLLAPEFVEETEEWKEVKIPVTIAGYIDENALKEYYTLNNSEAVLIVPEQGKEIIDGMTPESGSMGFDEKDLLFSVKDGETSLIRRLSQMENLYGQSAVQSAGLVSGYTDFKNAILKIADIVAVCFSVLVAVICLLNLYNSVMGRKLARHQELTVLYSMGMTKKQKSKMLLLENIRLLIRSFVFSGVITAIFVVCLHQLMNSRFGKMIFTFPVWVILLTAAVSVLGLFGFTLLCYRQNGKNELIEEVRTEMV